MNKPHPHKQYTPTLEEIRKVCEEIREGWSADKWANQSRVVPWSLPVAKNPGLKEDNKKH